MMNEAILIWLYISLKEAFGASVFICFSAAVIMLLGYCFMLASGDEEAAKIVIKWGKRAAITSAALIIITSFIPSKDDIKYIIGGAAVWNSAEYLADSEEGKQIPDNILKAMNSFLEETQKEDK